MIVSKTPFRLNFFSGGSDLPAFYKKEEGAALSVTINKFLYVMVHKSPTTGVKISYDKAEEWDDVDNMREGLTKTILQTYGINKGISIASMSDIVTSGSGLGSSSAFTVGLLNAINAENPLSAKFLAEKACDIEINKCSFGSGKQDQCAAAFGGLNLYKFYPNEEVEVLPVEISYSKWKELESKLLLVYSGKTRSANKILWKQQEAVEDPNKMDLIRAGRHKAHEGEWILRYGKIDDFGRLLHETWMEKRRIVTEISDPYFDNVYNTAIEAGAQGGKLLGAGGGGFFLFFVQPDDRSSVVQHLNVNHPLCKVYDFSFYNKGSSLHYLSS